MIVRFSRLLGFAASRDSAGLCTRSPGMPEHPNAREPWAYARDNDGDDGDDVPPPPRGGDDDDGDDDDDDGWVNAEVFGPFLSIAYIGRATSIYATIHGCIYRPGNIYIRNHPLQIHHVFTGKPRVARVVCRFAGAIAPQPPRSDATTCMVDLQ